MQRPQTTRGKVLLMMGVTLAIGLAMSATQWVPVAELLQYSNRRVVPIDQGYIYLPPWYLLTLVFPNLFGAARDADMLRLFTAVNVSHDHSLYLGIVALVVVGFSVYCFRLSRRVDVQPPGSSPGQLLSPEARSRIGFFCFLAVLALFIMMAAPIYVHITRFVPVAQTIRVIVRAGVLFTFAGSVLAGFGTELLLSADSGLMKRYSRIVFKFSLLVVGFVFVCVIASYWMSRSGLFEGAYGERPTGSGAMNFAWRSAAALSGQFTPPNADILIPVAVLLTLCLLLAACHRAPESARWLQERQTIFVALVLLVLSDLSWNSRQYNPSFDRMKVFPRTKITELLRSLPPGRVLVTPSDLETNRRAVKDGQKIIAPPNTLLSYGIHTVTGKDQLFPKQYREFCSLIEPQAHLSHVVFEKSYSPFFNLLNVKYVLTHSSQTLPGYKLLASEEGVSLYENGSGLPRAFFANRVVEVSAPSEALAVLNSPNFDVRSTAVIQEGESSRRFDIAGIPGNPITGSTESSMLNAGTATVVADRRNLVVIATQNESDGLLVLADNYYPGWKATVDGQPVELLRANHTMRAVNVPAGRHMVVFEFDPNAFWLSAKVSIAVAILAIGVLVVLEVRRRLNGVRTHDLR